MKPDKDTRVHTRLNTCEDIVSVHDYASGFENDSEGERARESRSNPFER